MVHVLKGCMWACREWGLSFNQHLEEARKQFQKEVREETDRKPLPERTK